MRDSSIEVIAPAAVAVVHLLYSRKTKPLFVATYGRSIWRLEV